MNDSHQSTVARTILRVVTGFLFAAHGWQKYNEWTIAGTQAAFGQMGIPLAEIVAPVISEVPVVHGSTVELDSIGEGIEGAVDRYVAMTRATRQLVILTGP